MTALPMLDGVGFRMFRGRADYPDLARIITASARGEGDDRVETAEALGSAYDHLERCDPEHDLLVAEVDGLPVAYSRVWWDDEADGRVYKLVGFVDPAYGGRGIGAAVLAWNEARLREIAAVHDVSDEARRRRSSATATSPRPRSSATRATSQSRTWPRWSGRRSTTSPTTSFPRASRSGPCERRTYARSGRPTWRRSRTTGAIVEPTEVEYERFRAYPYLDPTLWKIAWDDEGVAGQVKSFIDTAQNEAHGRKRGWTEAISTSRRWRRRGVAKALIVESIRELAARGMTEVALGVHTENPNGAYQLYESLGYEVSRTWTTYRKPL